MRVESWLKIHPLHPWDFRMPRVAGVRISFEPTTCTMSGLRLLLPFRLLFTMFPWKGHGKFPLLLPYGGVGGLQLLRYMPCTELLEVDSHRVAIH